MFGAEDVIEIASKIPMDGETFLIGGQAIGFWAWFHADRHPALLSSNPLTSRDVDFYGSVAAARILAKALEGAVRTPSGDVMNTPQTAIVDASFAGRPLRIDFLGSVLGVDSRSLLSGVSAVEVAASVNGEERQVRICLMNPVNCLKSRIGNMMSVATRRRDELAFRQLHAAVAVVGLHIDDAIARGDHKEATTCLGEIFEYLRSHEFGREADTELGIDVLGILLRTRHAPRLDETYRRMTIAGMVERIVRDRTGRETRRAATIARSV